MKIAWAYALGLIGFYALAIVMQSQFLIGCDISWGLHEARRLLAGGTYLKDFFEPSPPMFLFLYTVPLLAQPLLHLSIFTTFKIYIFCLITLSSLLSFLLIKKIFSKNDQWLALFLFLSITFTLLICFDFGQREHLLLIFSMPYFLLKTLRLEHRPVNRYFAFFIGIFAFLGFALKPFFVIPFFLTELYLCYAKKTLWAWCTIESLTIIISLMAYAAIILLFYPTYLTNLLQIRHLYYVAYGDTTFGMILHPVILFCGMALFFSYLLCPKQNSYHALNQILMVALIGFLCSYFLHGTMWYYHLYPAYSIAIILLTLQLGILFKKAVMNANTICFLSIMTFIFFMCPVSYTHLLFIDKMDFKKNLTPFILFLKQYANEQPIYFLADRVTNIFPAVDYAGIVPISRYASTMVWILAPGELARKNPDFQLSEAMLKNKNELIETVVDEITHYQPNYILVDSMHHKHLTGVSSNPYIAALSKNARFQKEWAHYHYLTSVKNKDNYAFALYERTPKKISTQSKRVLK